MNATPQGIPPEVARRAVEWLVALQSEPLPEGMRQQWSQWRAASAVHEQAWQHIEAVNGRLSRLGGPAAPVASAIAHATLLPPRSPRRRQAVQALAVLLFAGGVAWTVEERTPWRPWLADVRTGVGEQRTLALADGTQLVLNTDSAVNLRFTGGERRLQLVAGEILVSTAKDASMRPFLVETPQGEAQALGTRFSVRTLERATQLGVFQGAVRIRPRAGGAASLVLQAGQQTAFSRDSIAAPQPVDELATAWADGFIVARGMPLADFLAELGRYSPHPLACDPAVARLRVSGSYPVSDIPRVLDTLSATFSLQVETVTRFWGRQVVRTRLAPRGGA